VQLGTVKVCVILGLRLGAVPYPERALRHDDLRVLAVIPTEHSTGEVVAAQLEQAAARTGNPRQIVRDHGSDVKKGSELFAQRHPETVLTYDAAHHGALVLQRRFTADPRWAEFVSQLGQVKARLQQTSDAFLLAPSLRPKARFMNLASLLRWGRRILELLDRGPAGGRASVRAEARYGWLREFRTALEEWSRWEATVRHSVEFVRMRGLSCSCQLDLAARLQTLPPEDQDETLAIELCEFVFGQHLVEVAGGLGCGFRLAGFLGGFGLFHGGYDCGQVFVQFGRVARFQGTVQRFQQIPKLVHLELALDRRLFDVGGEFLDGHVGDQGAHP
jgi:hypothetical protein